MKNKNFLNKIEELKPEVPVQKDVEKNLLPRLKLMGSIMIFFAVATFIFALVVEEDTFAPVSTSTQLGFPVLEQIENASGISNLVEESQIELNPMDVLNFYMVSLVFGIVAISCFLTVWRKRKTLFHKPHHH